LSVDAYPRRAPSALDEILRRAGAVFADREGTPVAVSYGSAAGELAACVSRAGIADCSQMTKLELIGTSDATAELVRRVTGSVPAPGGVLHAGGAWWCGADVCDHGGANRVIVLCEPQRGARIQSLLSARTARLAAVELHDRSREWSAIAVVGAAAASVLKALGVFGPCGDPRHVPPFTSGRLGGVDTLWLLVSDRHAIALVSRPDADVAWHEIERAGRPVQICCVGQDAVARFALLQRRAALV
jgi:glycine cleavage system aminomethyltransferase T